MFWGRAKLPSFNAVFYSRSLALLCLIFANIPVWIFFFFLNYINRPELHCDLMFPSRGLLPLPWKEACSVRSSHLHRSVTQPWMKDPLAPPQSWPKRAFAEGQQPLSSQGCSHKKDLGDLGLCGMHYLHHKYPGVRTYSLLTMANTLCNMIACKEGTQQFYVVSVTLSLGTRGAITSS